MSKSRRTISRSALALAVLLLLGESPMHPYQMHRMLRERRKEDVLDVRPAAIYRLVERLDGAGLIEPLGTSRQGKRPERTVYRITDEGRELSDERLREMLAMPEREYPSFPAALSMAGVLPPDAVAQELKRRAIAIEGNLARMDVELRSVQHLLARVHLLEVEHAQAVLRAEVEWLHAVVTDIRSGRLTWDPSQLVASEADRRERTAGAGLELE
ncbi:MAG TPA: PadR family transcriptional regulator [Candidatus Dormibacteraeota bacterium]|nr:PadR family transcriptional regulator [Candidatus Dormibacteraeota bacterium]